MFYREVLQPIMSCISAFESKNAFCIDESVYSYHQIGRIISGIRTYVSKFQDEKVGIVANDDIYTYSSIIALWLEGKCYIPLHPNWPLERCVDICEQVGIKYILDSSDESRYANMNVIKTTDAEAVINFQPKENVSDDELAYILFTSGSTGKPKGVPISRGNVASFVKAFWDIGFIMDENDKCLQCFDLTFDLSVMSYLVPLTVGACVYTIPPVGVKYIVIPEILEDHGVTVALMAPSTINYLKPYFDEIELPELRYSLFCGEALREEITEGWSKCVPNAEIYNVYGPTEDTIFCTYYKFNRNGENKSHNGVLSIGRTMTSGNVKILNEDGAEVGVCELGELSLYGGQLFREYWKNEEKTRDAFVVAKDGRKYYKSGDVCFRDADGDIMYSGRLDHQAKIQGFRVELGEVEWHAREFLQDKNVVCMAFENRENLTEIAIFIESEQFDNSRLVAYMRGKMPSYMIPTKWIFVPTFPLNANDKIDKVKLKELIEL